jgi:hypothetical protein
MLAHETLVRVVLSAGLIKPGEGKANKVNKTLCKYEKTIFVKTLTSGGVLG